MWPGATATSRGRATLPGCIFQEGQGDDDADGGRDADDDENHDAVDVSFDENAGG